MRRDEENRKREKRIQFTIPVIGQRVEITVSPPNAGPDRQPISHRETDERDMVKRLKILMSIPINSPEYPEHLDDLLERLWEENAETGRSAVWKNSYVRLRGCLEWVKESAERKSDVRIKNSLQELKNLTER